MSDQDRVTIYAQVDGEVKEVTVEAGAVCPLAEINEDVTYCEATHCTRCWQKPICPLQKEASE